MRNDAEGIQCLFAAQQPRQAAIALRRLKALRAPCNTAEQVGAQRQRALEAVKRRLGALRCTHPEPRSPGAGEARRAIFLVWRLEEQKESSDAGGAARFRGLFCVTSAHVFESHLEEVCFESAAELPREQLELECSLYLCTQALVTALCKHSFHATLAGAGAEAPVRLYLPADPRCRAVWQAFEQRVIEQRLGRSDLGDARLGAPSFYADLRAQSLLRFRPWGWSASFLGAPNAVEALDESAQADVRFLCESMAVLKDQLLTHVWELGAAPGLKPLHLRTSAAACDAGRPGALEILVCAPRDASKDAFLVSGGAMPRQELFCADAAADPWTFLCRVFHACRNEISVYDAVRVVVCYPNPAAPSGRLLQMLDEKQESGTDAPLALYWRLRWLARVRQSLDRALIHECVPSQRLAACPCARAASGENGDGA